MPGELVKKMSAFPDGGLAADTDYLMGQRAGGNIKLTLAAIRAAVTPVASRIVVITGAQGDGITNDAGVIQAAMDNSPAGSICMLPPPGVFYKCSTGLTVPQTRSLQGLSYAADAGNTGFLGVELRFDIGVGTCITLTGGGSAAAGALRCVTINRAAGAVPAGSIGVLFQSVVSGLAEDVHIFRQETALKTKTCVAFNASRVVTTQITGTHFWYEDTVQVRMLQTEAGKNGALDVNCNEYIRIKGASDTVWAAQCQFNLSSGLCTNALVYDSISNANGIVTFVECHFELISHLVAQTGIGSGTRLTFLACTININGGVGELFFVPAGFLPYLTMIGCPFILGTPTFNGFTHIKILGNAFLFNVVIAAGSSGTFVGNDCNNDLALTGAMVGLAVDNNSFPATGSITNTASGNYSLGTGNVIDNAGNGRAVISRQQGATGFGLYTFAQIGAPVNGTVLFVTDGLSGSHPLAGGGTGCLAVRQNGAWQAMS